ncbi:MAG: V-type ATP synthase subunit D [Candidatus Micrarchaeia archaeon]
MYISATRMNLIKTKEKLKLTKMSYKLLKKKQEVLVMEFLRMLKQSSGSREELDALLDEAYRSVAKGFAITGENEFERVAGFMKDFDLLHITINNIMGVKIAEFHPPKAEINVTEEYSILGTSSAIDDAKEEFTELISKIIEVAKTEQGLKKLIIEIEKVKRRVNALEYSRIPALQKQSQYINMRLSEIERSSFSSLKHIKKKLEKENKV